MNGSAFPRPILIQSNGPDSPCLTPLSLSSLPSKSNLASAQCSPSPNTGPNIIFTSEVKLH
ncbi:hypothetical protein Ahy_A03g010436 isoform E [Arachis hypogaea]|uniref:Uncharacterized protein n=1 Tax=Arachis hypogaea TaxID=3818 RepID=A0A445DM91_ARAHY|nr:hypothetical protein Ahy_A03g010436 isoform E [Arachis hypogaea]